MNIKVETLIIASPKLVQKKNKPLNDQKETTENAIFIYRPKDQKEPG